MTQAKIEPGKGSISLGGKTQASHQGQDSSVKERDVLPKVGPKTPTKQQRIHTKASPLNPEIDLGD